MNSINKVFDKFEKEHLKYDTKVSTGVLWFYPEEWNQLKSEIQEIHDKDVILLQEHMKNIMSDNKEKDKEIERLKHEIEYL